MRLLIALAVLLWAGPLHAEDARTIAAKVQRVYDDTRTFQAKFRQTYVVKVQNVRKVSSGRVAFAKPGKLSFRYDEGNRVVSDGKTVKVYERDNQQMFENEVARSQYPAALAFLTGEGRLSRDFKLRLLDAKRMKVKNAFVLEGVPRDASPAYEKVLFYVDAATAQVRRVLVLDAQGNRNRFDFSQPVRNKPVTGGEFRFTPPRGTTVIKP